MVTRNVYVLFSSLLFSSFFLILMTTSCQREDDPVPVSFTPDTEQEGMMKLGKKLENPYTVENMRKAYQNLVNRGMLKSGIEIDATHLYIRYLPEDDQEMENFENDLLNYMNDDDLDQLEEEYGAHFFDFPLDYEIEEGGDFYYDPELPPGGITWQYTVVPVNYDMPVVNYEVIDPLYLDGAEFEVAYKAGGGLQVNAWDLLETEALILAGDPEAEISVNSKLKGPIWYPAGTIRVWDDILNQYIPLEGAKVMTVRWFKTRTAITSANGHFCINDTYTRSVRTYIKWERSHWDIRSGNWGQAWYNTGGGDNRLQPFERWNLDIGGAGNTNKSIRYATIHRALFRYYYGERLGLKAPFIAPWWESRLKVGYYHDKDNLSSAIPYRNWLTAPHIKIYGKYTSGNWKQPEIIFATTCHELAHVSHWDIIGEAGFALLWVEGDTRIIPESWADAVEWGLTNLEYHTLGQKYGNYHAINYYHEEGNQRWYKGEDDYYTPLFIDLVDDINQKTRFGGDRPNDNVEGYTLSSLESSLFFSRHLLFLKSWLKSNKPVGVTNEDIDELIDFYINL